MWHMYGQGKGKEASKGKGKGAPAGKGKGYGKWDEGWAQGEATGWAKGWAKDWAKGEAKGKAKGEAKGAGKNAGRFQWAEGVGPRPGRRPASPGAAYRVPPAHANRHVRPGDLRNWVEGLYPRWKHVAASNQHAMGYEKANAIAWAPTAETLRANRQAWNAIITQLLPETPRRLRTVHDIFRTGQQHTFSQL